jgi:5-methylcytosine-specific restriction endonuclease McrA
MTTLQDLSQDRLTPRQRLSHKLRDGKYRARLAGNVVTDISVDDVAHWLDNLRCYYCRVRLLTGYALEHKHPIALGGSHTLDNIAPACFDCNTIKHTMTEEEFLEVE